MSSLFLECKGRINRIVILGEGNRAGPHKRCDYHDFLKKEKEHLWTNDKTMSITKFESFVAVVKYLLIYLTIPGLSCSMQDLVPWPEMESRPLALGVLTTGPPGKSQERTVWICEMSRTKASPQWSLPNHAALGAGWGPWWPNPPPPSSKQKSSMQIYY